MLRIIDKNTKLFIRDDFTFDKATEIGLDVAPAQGLYHPKWNGTEWVEGGSKSEKQPQEPTEIELLRKENEMNAMALMELAEIIMGGDG